MSQCHTLAYLFTIIVLCSQAVSVIERVVEQLVSRGETRAISPLQDSIIDTARSSTQNGGKIQYFHSRSMT